jgi:hypothetical protein
MGLKKYRLLGGAVAAVAVLLLAGVPAAAQEFSPEPGICDGANCGPSGAFTAASFPTLRSRGARSPPTRRALTLPPGRRCMSPQTGMTPVPGRLMRRWLRWRTR